MPGPAFLLDTCTSFTNEASADADWDVKRCSCAGFAARLFGEAAEDDGPDHASEQLLAVAASINKAGDKLHPLSFQQVRVGLQHI